MESTTWLLTKEVRILKDTYSDIYYLLDKTCAALFFEKELSLVTLDNIERFYALHEEIRGDISKITDSAAARAIYGSFEALQLVMRLRELYWRKHYKGVVAYGKVTFVKFKSDLSEAEERFLEENINALRSNVQLLGNDRH